MGFFKKIAQDPDEGPGQTKDCTACQSTPGKNILPALGDSPQREIQCQWCNGTLKVHK